MTDYQDILRRINSSTGASNVPLASERAKVSQSQLTAQQRVASSAGMIPEDKYQSILSNINARAAGAPRESGGGVLGLFGRTVGKGLEGLLYTVGTPSRFITSTIKEVGDVFDGKGFSPSDLVKQTLDKNFYPSTIIAKTGNRWLDTVIGLGADIALDPLMLLGAGPVSAASRAGRIAFAEKAIVEGTRLGLPELVLKADDIVRFGPRLKTLTTAERDIIGAQKGLRWNFGPGNKLVFQPGTKGARISEATADALNALTAPLAKTRAVLGDTRWARKIQDYVRPASYAGTMNRLGRGELTAIQAVRQLAEHSSAVRGAAEGRLFEVVSTDEFGDLIQEFAASPYRATVHEVLHGDRLATDAAEQALADRMANFYENSMGKVNQYVDELNTRRGVSARRIEPRKDYGVNHTLSKDAGDFWFSGKWKKSKYAPELEKSLGLTPGEVIYGPSITRARKLTAGEKWLGETLQTGSVAEINRIAQQKLGFKWFEENADVLMKDYIASAANQVSRITFADRMLDFGPDVAKAVTKEVVSDPKILKQLDDVVDAFTSVYNNLGRHLSSLQGEATQQVLKPATRRAQTRVSARATAASRRVDTLKALRDSTAVAVRKAERLAVDAGGREAQIRGAVEEVLSPLRERLAKIESALASSNANEALAVEGLVSNYRRVFGPGVPIPDNPTEMLRALRGEQLPAGFRAEELAARAGQGEDVAQTLRLASGQEQAITRARKVRTDEAVLTQPQARKEISAGRQMITKEERKLETAIKSDPVIKKAKDAETASVNAINALDGTEALVANDEIWSSQIRPALQTNIDAVRAQGARRGTAKQINTAWADETDRMMMAMATSGFFSDAELKAWDRILVSMKSAEAELAQAEAALGVVTRRAEDARLFGNQIADKIDEGWKQLEGLGVQIPGEQYDLLRARVEELRTPQGIQTLNKMFRSYNQFFKITAMLTPGFIVRNGYSAAFNNFVAGVGLRDTRDAIAFTRAVRRMGYDKALAALPEAQREIYATAFRGVTATGAGMTRDMIVEPVLGGRMERFLNLKGVRKWEEANASTEVAVRLALGLKGARDGLNLEQIAAMIGRFHFDYSDLSKLDQVARQFVPFWLWVTRNIPLQIVNQAMRPGMYNAYESLRRQMPVDENLVLPKWLARRGPLGFGGGSVLNPDLPFVDLQEQIKQLSDPLLLLSQLYPQYKLPIELAGGRRLSTGAPFSEEPQAVRGPLDLPAALVASLTGQGTDLAGGGYGISDKVSYALTSLFPTLGQAQRLVPQLGGSPRYGERQSSAVLSTLFGLPYRGVPLSEQERELKSRQFAIRDYLSKLTQQGFIQPQS